MSRTIVALMCVVFLSTTAGASDVVVGRDGGVAVKKGTSLYRLARHLGLSLDAICLASGIKPALTLPRDQTLVLPQRHLLPLEAPADGLLVNIPERGAYLFRHGKFMRFYPLAVGRPGFETPRGHFTIVSKVKNPTWLPPAWAGRGEVVVPAGPDNPLGDRWIGLSAPGIGLHATTEPSSIGDDASHGCMRLYPEMAADLFDRVKPGMPVWIVYQPIKIRVNPADGRIYAQVFPDIYHRDNLAALALKLLKSQALTVGMDRLQPVLAAKTGRVVTLNAATARGAASSGLH